MQKLTRCNNTQLPVGAGSAAACAPNVRAAWPELLRRGETAKGRAGIRQAMRICTHSRLDSPAHVAQLAAWASDAWSSMVGPKHASALACSHAGSRREAGVPAT